MVTRGRNHVTADAFDDISDEEFVDRMRQVREIVMRDVAADIYGGQMAELKPIILEVIAESDNDPPCTVAEAVAACCRIVAHHPTKSIDGQAWYMCAGMELILEQENNADHR